jgi:hypothetical protein
MFVSAIMDFKRHICAENGGLLMKKFNKILCTILVLSMLVALLPTTAKAATKKEPSLSKTKVSLCVGQSTTLKVKNSGSSKVTWKSSNKKIATISSKGKLKGVKSGGCVITCKVGKKSIKCKVTIRKHSWKTIEETGHFEKVKTGTRKVVVCDCGEKFYDNETFQAHHNETHDSGTVTTEPTYETKWIVDKAEHKICKYCKKEKS